jgi:hypothetical protein
VGSAERPEVGEEWLVAVGWLTGADPRGSGAELCGGLGLASGMWLTDDWMVDTARWVHTAGLGLPVAAAALRAVMPIAPSPTNAGASRHGRLARAHLTER